MIRHWIGPAVTGAIAAILSFQMTLIATPRLLMAAAHHRVSASGVNRFTFAPLATAASRAIVRPSPDLAYSVCPFDLAKAPLLIDVPPVPSAYWSLSVFDAETNVAFVRNNLDSSSQAIHVAVAQASQAVPANYTRVTVSAAKGIALVRILVEGSGQFAAIDRARRATVCRLSL